MQRKNGALCNAISAAYSLCAMLGRCMSISCYAAEMQMHRRLAIDVSAVLITS
jgi:hypothetical protein